MKEAENEKIEEILALTWNTFFNMKHLIIQKMEYKNLKNL